MIAVSFSRVLGSIAALISTLVGHHMSPSAPMRSAGATAARIPRSRPRTRNTIPATATTPRIDDAWRELRTSDQRRRRFSRWAALTRLPALMSVPRTFLGTLTCR